VNRTDIIKFAELAKDVKQASSYIDRSIRIQRPPPDYWDELIFVSTVGYDDDATSFARKYGIRCYHYDGQQFKEWTKRLD